MLDASAGQTGNIVNFGFTLIPAHKPEQLQENMRSSIARGLPTVGICHAHDGVLSIVGGGPSLKDTYRDIEGYVGAVNGSLAFLLDKGLVPHFCGVCDPSPHMVDIVEAHVGVTYFLGSVVHPSVYDKLINAGCVVYRWNLSSIPGGEDVLKELEPDYLLIGGGSTMGLRWIPLGYTLGFRKFHLHGMDSSFREKSSHAYPDHQDAKEWINFEGYQTRPNFIGQVVDFIGWMDRLKHPDVEPVEIKVFGEGLLQSKWEQWKARNPAMHDGNAKPELVTDHFVWPEDDRYCRAAIHADAESIPFFMRHVNDRRIAVQAGGNVGVYPARLAQYFDAVHTFEPDPKNYECLARNIEGIPGRIMAHRAALGAKAGTVSTEMFEANNAGAVRVVEGEGDVPMRAIDDLDLPVCDLIWLDIEGYELNALKGAAQTIARHAPAVIIEEKALPEHFGLPITGARDWLESRGYAEVARNGSDRLFTRASSPGITIAAVQVGNYEGRGAEYVAKLFASVEKRLPAGTPVRFVCFTDDPGSLPDYVEARPVEPGLKGWWAKLAMFREGAFDPGTRVLYFDLDTLVVGSLADLVKYRGRFTILRDVYRPHGMQSSVMAWEAGTCDHIWSTWDAAGRPMIPGGDQSWIEVTMPQVDFWQELFPGRFVSFKKDCLPIGRFVPDASVIVFHGRPRPHECEEAWVRDAWDG